MKWNFARINREAGEANIFLIGMILFAVLAVGMAGAFFWAYSERNDYKENSDSRVATAVEKAKSEQKAADEKHFKEEEKKPNRKYESGADFGTISFDYPKTWSQYIAKDDGELAVYFYPDAVPTVSKKTAFALRVTEINKDYNEVVEKYQKQIDKKGLKATPLTIGKTKNFAGYKGIRFDGQFDDAINGAVVIFKIRDKTLQIFVDHQNFMKDFNQIILKTLQFAP